MSDYTELYRSLDMDLDKHDQLMAVLPVLFGDVYMSQENRPKGMDYFNFVLSEAHGLRIVELNEHRKNGGKVAGVFCVFVPDEIILASGAIGVGLCAGSQFWVADGETVLPKNLCPLIKSFTGAKISKSCPYFQSCDLLIGETTCDGKKKAYEVLEEYATVHVMELPQKKRGKSYDRWKDEIDIFIKTMEDLTGNKITPQKLKSSIKLVNQKRTALKRLYDLRKHTPSPISGLDALLISQIAFYDDPERFISKVNELCDELEIRIQTMPKNNKKRIMLTGTPEALPNWKIHNIIEKLGAEVVVEESCTGTRYFENFVDEGGETIDEMVRNLSARYMDINCACFTPNNDRMHDIKNYAKDFNVDGIIGCDLSFCNMYAIESMKVEKTCKDNSIPYLHIESDYSEEDTEQIKTRVEAFLEMLV